MVAAAEYEAQDSAQTLADGVAEYYARYPGLSAVGSMPADAQA